MRRREKILLAALLGVGTAWGAKTWLRSRRRIDLAGRVIVITGGTSGHGLIVAKLAAGEGARLVIAARNPGELRAAEEELRQFGARDVLAVPTDVSDPEQARALIVRTIDHFGRLDVLINNAGVISVGPVEAMNLDDFRQAMATNFWGAVYTTLAALPTMRNQQFGRIGNVVSIGGKLAVPHLLPYSASKFALTGFTEGLRSEVAHDNILVTGIYPTTMRTGGHTHAWFKGNQEAEYTWFALTDSIPGISLSAESVARKLLEALKNGDPELYVPWVSQVAAAMQAIFPSWVAETLSLLDRTLPAPTGTTSPAIQGQHLAGKVPSVLNRAVPPSARPGIS
jgi:NAD(P)-dependent dehydrogenase (short-subunit alcohol dehydrogenase family)